MLNHQQTVYVDGVQAELKSDATTYTTVHMFLTEINKEVINWLFITSPLALQPRYALRGV